MTQQRPRNPITFRQGQVIGEPAAEDDDEFLFDNFVENFTFQTLTDLNSPRFLLLGRTGTGKTAILREIERRFDNVIRIDPQELSLQYISNSDIINFFQNNGVKLDLFYQLLWRHVLATELIKSKFHLNDEKSTQRFFSQVSSIFNANRRRAIEYMQSFGSGFWLETDARVTQVTQKFESELKSAAGVNLSGIKADLSSGDKFSEEEKKEIISRAQQIVDSVRIQQLSEVIDWLADEVFVDKKTPFYLVIDDLDLDFASGRTKLQLIRALIETCKKFRRVANVKIAMAIRTDLLERVFESTREEGFQEEKYKGNYATLEWREGELKELTDKRVRASIRRQYTGSEIGFSDVFPDRISQSDAFKYILGRTLQRPRDIIAFVNECIVQAVGSDRVSLPAIRNAEEGYSVERFNALRDEWRGQYPFLDQYCKPLIGRPRRFEYRSVTAAEMEELMVTLAMNPAADTDRLAHKAVTSGSYGGARTNDFEIEWIDALFKVGILGIKTDPGTPVKWSYKGRQTLNAADVNPGSMIYVHPMLWKRLGIVTKGVEPDTAEI